MNGPGEFVGRGGHKLRAALEAFGVSPAGVACADLGCSAGGFTDCLLQHGAARVYAVDTAYGQLAWKLRNDPRVVVMERTNALHATPAEAVALVVIDLGWTRQERALPAAARWLAPGGRIITLIKPHYEVEKSALGPGGVLDEDAARATVERVIASIPAMGLRVEGLVKSPVLGGADASGKGRGNAEWLALAALA